MGGGSPQVDFRQALRLLAGISLRWSTDRVYFTFMAYLLRLVLILLPLVYAAQSISFGQQVLSHASKKKKRDTM